MSINMSNRLYYRTDHDFKKTNSVWNRKKFNSIEHIGHVMDLIHQCNPKNKQEWIIFYEKWWFKHFNSLHLFSNIKFQFARAANISVKKAYIYIFIRVIDETYLGYKRETDAIEQIKQIYGSDYSILKTDYVSDYKYGIDVLIMYKGKIVKAIQLKSQQFINNMIYYHFNRGVSSLNHNRDFINKYHIPIYYWSYENIRDHKCKYDIIIK